MIETLLLDLAQDRPDSFQGRLRGPQGNGFVGGARGFGPALTQAGAGFKPAVSARRVFLLLLSGAVSC